MWFKEISVIIKTGLIKLYRTMKFGIGAIQFLFVMIWIMSSLYFRLRKRKEMNKEI